MKGVAKPGRAEAMKAKCRDCMCDYTDGRKECGIRTCPLYPWTPYRKQTPDYTWCSDRTRQRLATLPLEPETATKEPVLDVIHAEG
jgi:hypothetical protein